MNLTEFDTTEDLAERGDVALKNMLDSVRRDIVQSIDFIVEGHRSSAGHPLRAAAKQLADAQTVLNFLCAHEARVSSNQPQPGIQV